MFIVAFEGIDKSGKETQTYLLQKHLREKHMNVITREIPRYETHTGQMIREILHGQREATPLQLAQLFEIDRYNFFEELEHMAKPDVLILDRYIMSNTFALTKGVDEIDLMWLQHGLPAANLHIFVDIPVEVSLKRGQNYDVLDLHETDVPLLQGTRDRYAAYAEAGKYYDKGDVVRVNGDQSVEEVHDDILKLVYPRLFGVPFKTTKEEILS